MYCYDLSITSTSLGGSTLIGWGFMIVGFGWGRILGWGWGKIILGGWGFTGWSYIGLTMGLGGAGGM